MATTDINYAVELYTEESVTDSSIGAVSGVLRYITGRPGYDGSPTYPTWEDTSNNTEVWYEGFLVRDGIGKASRSVDIEETGSYGTFSNFNFTLHNASQIWADLDSNNLWLNGKSVKAYVVIDDVFYQFWQGVVRNFQYTESKLKISCIDGFRQDNKVLPKIALTKTEFPSLEISGQSTIIPVCLGEIPFAKITKIGLMEDADFLYGYHIYTESSDNPYDGGPYLYVEDPGKALTENDVNFEDNGTFQNADVKYYIRPLYNADSKNIAGILGAVEDSEDEYVSVITLTNPIIKNDEEALLVLKVFLGVKGYTIATNEVEIVGEDQAKITFNPEYDEKVPSNIIRSNSGAPGVYYWDSDTSSWKVSGGIVGSATIKTSETFGIPFVSINNFASEVYWYKGYEFAKILKAGNGYPDSRPLFIDQTEVEDIPWRTHLKMTNQDANRIADGEETSNTVTTDEYTNTGSTQSNVTITKSQSFKCRIGPEDFSQVESLTLGFHALIDHEYPGSKSYTTTIRVRLVDNHGNFIATALEETETTWESENLNAWNPNGPRFQAVHLTPPGTGDPPQRFRPEYELNSNVLEFIKNLGSFGWLQVDFKISVTVASWSGSTTWDLTIDYYRLFLTGKLTAGLADSELYVRVIGESNSEGTVETVPQAVQYMFESDGLVKDTDFDIDDLESKRDDWYIARQITNQQPTFKHIQSLAEEAFFAVYPSRTGVRTCKCWTDDTTSSFSLTASEILRDSIKSVKRSDDRKMYNDYHVKYNRNPATNEYDRAYRITYANYDYFPPYDLGDVDGTVLVNGGSQSGSTLATDGYDSASGSITQGTLFTIANDQTLYQVTATGTISSNACTLSIYPALKRTPDDDAAIRFLSNGWARFASGFDSTSYSDANDAWNIAHAVYQNTRCVNPMPDKLSKCEWYVDRTAFDFLETDGLGVNSSPHKFLRKCLLWLGRQKLPIKLKLPVSSTNIALELCDYGTITDAIFTNAESWGGWISKVEVSPSEDAIEIEMILNPNNIDGIDDEFSRIIESGSQTDQIIESGSRTDQYIEGN